MRPRHPIPRLWLMTDERLGDALWTALARLPRGSGVVFRHYRLPPTERRALFERVRRVTRQRRLVLVVAGEAWLGRADGHHGAARPRTVAPGLYTRPVHSRREAVAAIRAGADLVFASPVFATRSHPGAAGLGPLRLGRMIAGLTVPVVALGGMDARRMRRLKGLPLHGWAAIDGWIT